MRRDITAILSLAAVLLAVALPATAAAQSGDRALPLSNETPVREYRGFVLFSRWDGSAYRLSVLHDGAVTDLPVRPQAQPFDADVGPDSSGAPSAIVSICDDSCDLYVVGFDPGDTPRPVRNANTTGHDETDPSIWKGRLVYARAYGTRLVPYTKRLAAPRSRPSDRLAALPAKRCGAVDPPDCRPVKRVDLRSMELWGRWVAQSWTYQPDEFPGFAQDEIRLTNVHRTDTRQIAAMTTGLGGQTYLGPSFSAGRLAFFRACQADPGGCSTSNSGALRYDISDRRLPARGRRRELVRLGVDRRRGPARAERLRLLGRRSRDPGRPVRHLPARRPRLEGRAGLACPLTDSAPIRLSGPARSAPVRKRSGRQQCRTSTTRSSRPSTARTAPSRRARVADSWAARRPRSEAWASSASRPTRWPRARIRPTRSRT